MKLVQRMFFEISFISFLIVFLDAFITGIFFFTVFHLLFTFFKIHFYYAIIASSLFFLISFIKKLKRNKILEIEKKYPELKERLRTSKDYKSIENPVVLALHTEILNSINIVLSFNYLNDSLLIVCII